MSNLGVYLVTKPECSPHLSEIERRIKQNGLNTSGIYRVKDWERIARKIYAPQLIVAERKFRAGFEGHIWITNHLFGNRGLVFHFGDCLAPDDPALINRLQKVYDLKQRFREDISKTLNGNLILFLNLDSLTNPTFQQGGITGDLGILSSKGFKRIPKSYAGRWDDVYFKYIHSPDVNINVLKHEWGVLLSEKIIGKENKISIKDWELMKKLGTQIPPSENAR